MNMNYRSLSAVFELNDEQVKLTKCSSKDEK